MAFTPKPLISGDAFEAALRFGLALEQDLAHRDDPLERVACLARHWRDLLELGWAGTLLPEATGGAGGEIADLVALADGAGRSAMPLPIAAACGVVPLLLRAVADAALPAAVATGRLRPCPVLEAGSVTARAEGERWLLDGSVLGLELVPEPTHYLLACPIAAAEPGLFLLPADASGLAATRHLRIDGRLSVDLALHGPARLLARGAAVQEAVAAARDLGAFLTCVEAVSAMGALTEQTIAYLSTRVQFGTALSTFQALRHRVAEMHIAAENTRGLVAQLLREAGTASYLPWREVSFAKLRLGEAGRFVAEAAIQLHGGMGMTEALPASRLARRIMLAEFEYGDRN